MAKGDRNVLLETVLVVGSFVLLQGSSSTSIEEVLGDTACTTIVGGGESTVEVWCQIDSCAIVFACCEDTRDGDAYIGSCICFRVSKLFVQ